jgi:hypothetical protein
LGVRITFDGAGDGLGQEAGSTGGEVVAQLEVASAQASHNSIRDGFGRSPVFFMLRSDDGHNVGLAVFDGSRALHLRYDRYGLPRFALGDVEIGRAISPFPAKPERGDR